MQRILVGLDSSERAPGVLQQAVELAGRYGAQLSVMRAVSIPVEFPIEALSIQPNGLPARLLTVAQASLNQVVQDVSRDRLARVEARLGTPWQVLCDVAREWAIDLIVIGTHGHSPIDRLLGTTAARVVNHAPCSVLVVRQGVSS